MAEIKVGEKRHVIQSNWLRQEGDENAMEQVGFKVTDPVSVGTMPSALHGELRHLTMNKGIIGVERTMSFISALYNLWDNWAGFSPVLWDEGAPAPGSADGMWSEARAEPCWSHDAQSALPCLKENVSYLKNIRKFTQKSLKLEKGSQKKCC